MQARQWTTKQWRSRDGKEHPGRWFTKASLRRLLKNVQYLGQVSCQGEVHRGEQEAIVDQAVWDRTQKWLASEQDGKRIVAGTSPESKKLGSHRRLPAPRPERAERVPRIARLLALALKFEELIRVGVVSNYVALAQVGLVSRDRVTLMTSLLNLAPDIQEEILFLRPEEAERLGISEPSLRKLTATLLWNQQREQWRSMRCLARDPRVAIEAGHS
jgi:hypothetical protein